MAEASGYQKAFSSLGCPDASLGEVLTLAQDRGIASVELRALGGTIDLPAYLSKLGGNPKALALSLSSSPVKIVAFGTSLRILDGGPADREKFLEFIPWAEALGVPFVRVFDGGKAADAQELGHAAEMAEWWLSLKAERAWETQVLVETHDSLITTEKIRAFLKSVPGIPILWDTHHTWKKGGEDPVQTWNAIGGQVAHIHVKDSISVPSAKHPFTYVIPGRGEFPMRPLAIALRSSFTGCVCLEWEKLWHSYLPPLAEALALADSGQWW